jgi:thiamine-phosphate pyrophosphorylase
MAIDFDILLITDRRSVPEDSFFFRLRGALHAGVRSVQLREKDLSTGELTRYALKIRKMTRKHNAHLYINDRVDVAMAVEADGVHLGGMSIPVKAVRKITGKAFRIGVSTHSLKEAADAQNEAADFITFGPVYETPSKMRYGRPLGIDMLRTIVNSMQIPVYAIGGINSKNIRDVMKTGVRGAAMISAIFGADDVEQKTKDIVRLIQ